MSSESTFRIAIRKFGPFESAIEKIWRSFQETTGSALTLDAEALDLNPLYESLFTHGGLKDGTWDVAFIVTDWLAEAVEEGALLDLAPYMRSAPPPDYPHGWTPALTQFQHFGDAVYGLPYHDGPECFIYRRDLFEDEGEQRAFEQRFGYRLAPPRSWEQFYDLARFFTRPERDLYGTVFAAFPDGHNSVYDFCLQLWSRCGDLADSSGAVTLDTPQAVAALDFYRGIVGDRTASYPEPETIDSVRSGELFSQGKVAMMVNWFGFAAACEQPDSPVKGKVAIAELPSGTLGVEEATSVSLSVYWTLAIGSSSRHKDEAYAFLRHACSAEMDKLTTLEGAIGCRLSTWSDPEVNTAIPFYHRLADLTPGARTLPRSRHFPALAHVIDEMVQQAISGSETSGELTRQAQVKAAHIRL
jgi:multiple sugar transport system substrate-binding protein